MVIWGTLLQRRVPAEMLGRRAVAVAAADNQITPAESKQIRARWEELKSVTEGFVACCEEGNFGPMKNGAAGKIQRRE